jgi:hypothetical protein
VSSSCRPRRRDGRRVRHGEPKAARPALKLNQLLRAAQPARRLRCALCRRTSVQTAHPRSCSQHPRLLSGSRSPAGNLSRGLRGARASGKHNSNVRIIPCANLSRSADLGRRGNAGSGHIAPGGGNRRKGLAVSSASKNRPGSQVLRLRNITVFRVYEGFDQAALLTSRRREVCDWPYQEADADRRRQPGRRRGALPTLIRWP